MNHCSHFLAIWGSLTFLVIASPIFAQETQLRSVVVREPLQVEVDGKPVKFGQPGDVLPLLDERKDAVALQNKDGLKGWVQRSDVVAFTEAAPIYTKLIKEKPKNAELYVLRGNVWAAVGDNEKAIADYSQAIRLGEQRAEVFLSRGAFYTSVGEYDKAIADYEQALAKGAKPLFVHTNRAAAYLAKQDFENAAKDYSRVIKLTPDQADGYVYRGIVRRNQQDWESAIADFSKALELDPKNVRALAHRGFSHYAQRDHAAAVDDFNEVIQLQPGDGVAFNNRGYNRQMLGDFAGALADYDQGIKLAPEYPLAYQNKAWLLATCPNEKYRDGKLSLKTAMTLCKMREYKQAMDIKALAAAYAELGDFDLAVTHQNRVVALTQDEQKSGEQEILKLYKAKSPFRMIIRKPSE